MLSVAVEAQRYFQEAFMDGKERPQMFWKSKVKYLQLSLLWLVTFWQFQLPVLLPKEHFREEN
jgi:hypothetical protein